MDDDGDDDEQYYSSAEGEATEQEDDMLMARRLTEEEFERFKKEGRCFICRAKAEQYTVPTTVYHLDAAKMAKELRKSRGEELFVVAIREVFDAVAELRTDQSTEWTKELKESLTEFADIIAEPTDLPPEREFDFEINMESDEPPKE
eukprot:jgi/Tetstr1/462194/TSEL_007257.t1